MCATAAMLGAAVGLRDYIQLCGTEYNEYSGIGGLSTLSLQLPNSHEVKTRIKVAEAKRYIEFIGLFQTNSGVVITKNGDSIAPMGNNCDGFGFGFGFGGVSSFIEKPRKLLSFSLLGVLQSQPQDSVKVIGVMVVPCQSLIEFLWLARWSGEHFLSTRVINDKLIMLVSSLEIDIKVKIIGNDFHKGDKYCSGDKVLCDNIVEGDNLSEKVIFVINSKNDVNNQPTTLQAMQPTEKKSTEQQITIILNFTLRYQNYCRL